MESIQSHSKRLIESFLSWYISSHLLSPPVFATSQESPVYCLLIYLLEVSAFFFNDQFLVYSGYPVVNQVYSSSNGKVFNGTTLSSPIGYGVCTLPCPSPLCSFTNHLTPGIYAFQQRQSHPRFLQQLSDLRINGWLGVGHSTSFRRRDRVFFPT